MVSPSDLEQIALAHKETHRALRIAEDEQIAQLAEVVDDIDITANTPFEIALMEMPHSCQPTGDNKVTGLRPRLTGPKT